MSKVQYNYSKLKGRIRERGETLKTLSAQTGISVRSLSDKWNGKSYFTQPEMSALKRVLKLESVDAYFFDSGL